MLSQVTAPRRVGARFVGLMAVVIGLSACDGGASLNEGVGFGDYQRYMRERDSGASGRPQSAGAYSIPPENNRAVASNAPAAPAPAAAPAASSNPYDAYGASAPVATTSLASAAPAPTPAPAAAAPAGDGTIAERPAGVQNEQDYLQVLARGTTATAASGPAEVVRVEHVPGGASSGPNVVAYALGTSHPVGETLYNRINPLRWQTWERNCLAFPGQDAAQEAFLANGGPERDRGNLDPDGDGYACWWDPSAYRTAARGG